MKTLTFLIIIFILLNLVFEKTGYTHIKKLKLETSPTEIGERISNNIVNRRFGWLYQKVCTYYGILIFADATENKNFAKQVTDGWIFKIFERKKETTFRTR